jgi:creatinine amidohydrolase
MRKLIGRLISIAGIAFVAAAPAALAQAPATVLVEELTWTELRDAIGAGKTTIVVPIGGTEQNGPHMALGKHNVRVKALSERIARALGNALVAPVVAYVPEGSIDPPTSHMRFPGTITVPSDTFQRVLESAARSFRHHGFRDVVFLGEHGGYQKDVAAAAARLNREWASTPARTHAVAEYYQSFEHAYKQALKARGLTDDEIGTHAGSADTSLTLALAPGLVRTERLKSGDRLGAAEGVYGNPRRATADLGQLGVDVIVAETVAAIRKATSRR